MQGAALHAVRRPSTTTWWCQSNDPAPTGGDNVVRGDAEGQCADLSDGPVLLVPACGDVAAVVLDEIRRLDAQRVVALGGEGAVCADVLRAAADA